MGKSARLTNCCGRPAPSSSSRRASSRLRFTMLLLPSLEREEREPRRAREALRLPEARRPPPRCVLVGWRERLRLRGSALPGLDVDPLVSALRRCTCEPWPLRDRKKR